MHYIYRYSYPPGGIVYIGQHKAKKGCTDYVNDGYHGSGRIWSRIYKKHPDECVKTILEVVETREEADELEIAYIEHYKRVYGKYCVNITKGGEGGPGAKKRFSKEELAEHRREYRQRPDVKAKHAEHQRKYKQLPEVKARIAEYRQHPDVKARRAEYYQRPEVKARIAERQREYNQRPEVKARHAERQRLRRARMRAELEEKNTP